MVDYESVRDSDGDGGELLRDRHPWYRGVTCSSRNDGVGFGPQVSQWENSRPFGRFMCKVCEVKF